MKGAEDENGPKWCWMHRLGTRCVFFLIFVFISYLLMFCSIYLGCTLRNMQQWGWWEAGTTRTGPNDAGCVVWALGVCVFFKYLCSFSYLLMFFSIYIGCTLRNMQQRGWWEAGTTRTGPNDAGCVVWATSKCFFNANGIQIVFHLKYLTRLTMYLIISEKSYLS